MPHYVAIDIGASSGRLIVANTDRGLEIKEIHRFENGFKLIRGHERWNMTQLVQEILIGLEKVKKQGITTCTIGIDTWAVDYVLLDKDGHMLDEPIAYRDKRTHGIMEKVFSKISKQQIYMKTGIQFLNFNTLFQLYAEDKALLKRTAEILMIPDYIAYVLTGKKVSEVTNQSTTQYLNIQNRDFDEELLQVIGINKNQLPKLIETGQIIGDIQPILHDTYDLPVATVVAVATHDTASAVIGVPATNEKWGYLSSGTWSLIGVEQENPNTGTDSYNENYTNEWGGYQTYRFLKNIAGLWPVQEIARMLEHQYTFSELTEQAEQVKPFLQYVNFNEERFINPINMIEEIQTVCRESHQTVPETVGELVMCVYSNLALNYAHEWKVLQRLTDQELDVLHIVGGGSNIRLLNQLTADVIEKPVISGPGEATAFGNIMVQMITAGELKDLRQARQWLADNQTYIRYEPRWMTDEDLLERYKTMVSREEEN